MYPKGHSNRNENAGLESLEKDVCQGLKDRVGYKEDGKTGIELTVCHMKILLETLDLCIPDIGPI